MEDLLLDEQLKPVAAKVYSGTRLDGDDGLRLLRSKNVLGIGYLADMVKRKKHKDKVYFVVNQHITPTNICINRCKFCAFSRSKGEDGAFLLSLDEIEAKALAMQGMGVQEVHIVGGLHPDLDLQYYLEMTYRLRRALPGVVVKALTAVEIAHLADKHGLPVEEVLTQLQAAGLKYLPGGGAEVFAPRVRALTCPEKISGRRWLEVHAAAHSMGIRTNATILYGHIETPEERVDHLLQLREQQDRTGGFLAFIPLAFQPKHTELARRYSIPATTAYDDLRMLAVSRLMLDNFDHIKAYWINYGPKLSQAAMDFGVDDIHGTVMEEKISHAAGVDTKELITKEELVRLIRAAGKLPVKRDAFYQPVEEVNA